MKFNCIPKRLTSILNATSITQLARKCGFMQRMRNISPTELVFALLNTLGTRSNINLSDIHKNLCIEHGKSINYKPFHNKLKKLNCFELLPNKLPKNGYLSPYNKPCRANIPFKAIEAHDGSSLKLHIGLTEQFPGRFTKTHPAAMELHMTMDLMSGGYNYLGIAPDSESERHYNPFAFEIKDILLLMDAGYFNIEYCYQADKHGGYVITRTNGQINPNIIAAFDSQGTAIKALVGKKMKRVKLKKDQLVDLDVKWSDKPGLHRLIAFWDRKKSAIGYLITNLKREQFPAVKVCELYGLRWQIELFFKELKSYSGLKSFNTRNKSIAESLVWASMLTLLLKRFIAKVSGEIHKVMISTQKVARCANDWLPDILKALRSEREYRIKNQLRKWCRYLSEYACRSQPKRDNETLFVQLTEHASAANNL
ncbi:IS4 family transposase [Shewanella sp. VB17]|uniref:IS4 family transposase n=1 Tax=Shewanella sp. VB17 TaxID=2739432 RepID=UPI001566053B|nr:IS4 family transposase [Shewanella sp. VB17]NRD71696.1 IS4 family transposase [Shewanella sp. VB17]